MQKTYTQIPGMNEFIKVQEQFDSFDKEYQDYLRSKLRLDIERVMNKIQNQIKEADERLEHYIKESDGYNVIKYDRDSLEMKYNVYAELLIRLSESKSHFEEVEWAFNKGKLRTSDEIQMRDDYFIFTTEEFQDKNDRNNALEITIFFLSLFGWFIFGICFLLIGSKLSHIYPVIFMPSYLREICEFFYIIGFLLLATSVLGTTVQVVTGISIATFFINKLHYMSDDEKRIKNRFGKDYINSVIVGMAASSIVNSVVKTIKSS